MIRSLPSLVSWAAVDDIALLTEIQYFSASPIVMSMGKRETSYIAYSVVEWLEVCPIPSSPSSPQGSFQ